MTTDDQPPSQEEREELHAAIDAEMVKPVPGYELRPLPAWASER